MIAVVWLVGHRCDLYKKRLSRAKKAKLGREVEMAKVRLCQDGPHTETIVFSVVQFSHFSKGALTLRTAPYSAAHDILFYSTYRVGQKSKLLHCDL